MGSVFIPMDADPALTDNPARSSHQQRPRLEVHAQAASSQARHRRPNFQRTAGRGRRRATRHGVDRGRRLRDGVRPALSGGEAGAADAGRRLLDRPTPITNAQFARFVEATGYVTFAERAPLAEDYPGGAARESGRGLAGLHPRSRPVPLDSRICGGRSCTAPTGATRRAGSSLDGLGDHPAVHVACVDVEAYCDWAGTHLPCEKEWEFAAGAGSTGDLCLGRRVRAGRRRLWPTPGRGNFPAQKCTDGWLRTSPAGAFPPNGYGLYDMIGNVWEWTADWCATAARGREQVVLHGQAPGEREPTTTSAPDPAPRDEGRFAPVRAQLLPPLPAGGAPAQPVDTSTSHIGFRCVVRPEEA